MKGGPRRLNKDSALRVGLICWVLLSAILIQDSYISRVLMYSIVVFFLSMVDRETWNILSKGDCIYGVMFGSVH